MTEALIRGWCPSAWRPMMAGDGFLVRVRPWLARMTREQVLGLCEAAATYGNGTIDLTNRAGLQIRGVAEAGLSALLERLVALDLIAADPALEARPAILVAPDWGKDDGTEGIAKALAKRLGELPELPGKIGFAIDISGPPVLTHVPADFRIERDETGGLIVRADGRSKGVAVAEDAVVDMLLAMARWFAESGGLEAGRMRRHDAPLPASLDGRQAPAPTRTVQPGENALGCLYGAPFGRVEADQFAVLTISGGARALRITPWRQVLIEGVAPMPVDGFLLDPQDATLRADACVGAPACPQATVETRGIALQLAPHVAGSLHVSGCAKGCARPAAADVVLTGRDGAYDLGFGGRAGDAPARSGLSARHIISLLGAS